MHGGSIDVKRVKSRVLRNRGRKRVEVFDAKGLRADLGLGVIDSIKTRYIRGRCENIILA